MAWVRLDRKTWHDERFRSWDPEQKLVWLYLLSAPAGNKMGYFACPVAYIAVDVGVPEQTVRDTFSELGTKAGDLPTQQPHGWERNRPICWDPDRSIIHLRNWLKYQPIPNGNVASSAAKELADEPFSYEMYLDLLASINRYWREHYGDLLTILLDTIMEKANVPVSTVEERLRILLRERLHEPLGERLREWSPKPPGTSNGTSTSVSSTHQQEDNNNNSGGNSTSAREGFPSLGNLPRNEAGHRQYPAEFEKLWKVYPDRDGPDPKGGAYRKWRANVEAGVDLDEMYKGVLRYRKWLLDRGKIGERYVSQAKTFLGPQEMWREEEYAGVDLSSADQQLMTKYRRFTQGGGADEQHPSSAA